MVVPARNGEDSIGDCLRSLTALEYPADLHELIVVDNASSDRTAEIAGELGAGVVTEPRLGVSNARNRGVAEGRGEVVAFIDDDCVAEPNWLDRLVEPLADPEVGAVAGEMRSVDPDTPAQRYMADLLGRWQRFAVSQRPPFAVCANLAVRRSEFELVGGFDPLFRRGQDVDFGWRLHEGSPLRLAFAEDAVVSHRHLPSASDLARQQFGWGYGAGLLGVRYPGHAEGHRLPPLREPALAGIGLIGVAADRARGRRSPEQLEFAIFEFARKGGWWAGAHAGRARGKLVKRLSG